MATPNEPYVEKTVIEQPGVRREEIRTAAPQRGSSTGWWIAALVAVIAIAGLFFMYSSNTAVDTELQAARENGRAEAMLDSATTQAQAAAASASEASANAASSMAEASRSAAESASAAAERTAEATQNAAASAGDAAADASDTSVNPPSN